jgi:UDP-N-acetylglucosamine--N-acetylmuramyl-(pentapeptide) pyrophosphoryl-undecaprenol N-acetylglucosamine transferase
MATGRPALVVPYPFHRDQHQLHNGLLLAEVGAAMVIEQAQLTPARLRATLGEFLDEPQRAVQMGQRARALHHPSAARDIVADLESLLGACCPQPLAVESEGART